jgi:septum formation protein
MDFMNSSLLVLASESPRRQQLLTQLGAVYSVCGQNIKETLEKNESLEDFVVRLACEKAAAGFDQQSDKSTVVLGADTIVVCGDSALGKPSSREDALRMLLVLSGKSHRVLSAVSLMTATKEKHILSNTLVEFRDIDEQEAERYWATGEQADKAGGYAIQGLGAIFVKSITGSYSGVMGLPLFETAALLKEFGIPLWSSK